MKAALLAAALCLFTVAAHAQGTGSNAHSHPVRAYVTRRGTLVPAHNASDPDRILSNNWTTKGNFSPFTGTTGHRTSTRAVAPLVYTRPISTPRLYTKPRASALLYPKPLAPLLPSRPAPAPLTAPIAQPVAASTTTAPLDLQAWVNPQTHVYHLPDSRWYGVSKGGRFLPLSDAMRAGYRPAGTHQ